MKDLKERTLPLPSEEIPTGKSNIKCKVKTTGKTIAIIAKHPGVSRLLICYTIEELEDVYKSISDFLKLQKRFR